MILSDNCGTLQAFTDIRHSQSGTFVANFTGPVSLEMNNWREGPYTALVTNFIDNMALYPREANFKASPHEISTILGGSSTLILDAGKAQANHEFLILSSVTGTHPGFSHKGIHVPLNLDAWTWQALQLINSPTMSNFLGVLDGKGKASAVLHAKGPLSPEVMGLDLYFDYVVLESASPINPQKGWIRMASHPLYVLFIP